MTATTLEEKVPLEAKNKPFMVCGFLGAFWNFCYGTEDHLGSTRMVLDENGGVKQALMYQPYGTVSDVVEMGATATDPLRQKFTTKELDEEGVSNEEAEIYYNLSISVPNDQYTITGEITYDVGLPSAIINFYYYDGISGDDYYYSIGTIGNSTGNTKITKIVLHITGLADLDFDYIVNGLNSPIPVGNSRTLTLNNSITAVQTAAGTGISLYDIGELVPLPNDMTIASYYFGARFYNPDLGIWLSTDPKDQLWNSYGYSSNPIMTIDPDGQYIIGAIIGGIIGAYGMGALVNGSLNPGKWDWDNAGTWTSMISGATAGASLGSGIENGILQARFDAGKISSTYGAKGVISANGGPLAIKQRYLEHYGRYVDRATDWDLILSDEWTDIDNGPLSAKGWAGGGGGGIYSEGQIILRGGTTYKVYSSENAAFRAAKFDEGIPRSAQFNEKVNLKSVDRFGSKGVEYKYDGGKSVRYDYQGHPFKVNPVVPHFNNSTMFHYITGFDP